MDPGFEQWARLVYQRAGLVVTDEDLAIIELVHMGYEGTAAALDHVDTARFPFAPIDPSCAPER